MTKKMYLNDNVIIEEMLEYSIASYDKKVAVLNETSLFLIKNCNNLTRNELIDKLISQISDFGDVPTSQIYEDCEKAIDYLVQNNFILEE